MSCYSHRQVWLNTRLGAHLTDPFMLGWRCCHHTACGGLRRITSTIPPSLNSTLSCRLAAPLEDCAQHTSPCIPTNPSPTMPLSECEVQSLVLAKMPGGCGCKSVQRKAAETWATAGQSRVQIRERLVAMSSRKRKTCWATCQEQRFPRADGSVWREQLQRPG